MEARQACTSLAMPAPSPHRYTLAPCLRGKESRSRRVAGAAREMQPAATRLRHSLPCTLCPCTLSSIDQKQRDARMQQLCGPTMPSTVHHRASISQGTCGDLLTSASCGQWCIQAAAGLTWRSCRAALRRAAASGAARTPCGPGRGRRRRAGGRACRRLGSPAGEQEGGQPGRRALLSSRRRAGDVACRQAWP